MMAEIQIDPAEIIAGLDAGCWQCNDSSRIGSKPWTRTEWLAIRPAGRTWIGCGDDSERCGVCMGRGYKLTNAGSALLGWMKRWADVIEIAQRNGEDQ